MSLFRVGLKLGSFVIKNRFYSTIMQEEMEMIQKVDKGLFDKNIVYNWTLDIFVYTGYKTVH